MDASTTPQNLIARNPATGAEIARVPATDPAEVVALVARASLAQADWGSADIRDRLAVLRRWWGILARDAEGWADAIRAEVGKPAGEAMAEVVASLDLLRWTVKNARASLADRPIGRGWQRVLLIPRGRLRWAPLGVVGIVGTWNYPLLLNAPAIAHALAAGNAVAWKPSELAVGLGQRLAGSIAEAGFPDGLVATLIGGPEVGRALAASAIAKGVFTGGVENGRRFLADLAARGIPAIVELSGFDPAVVLPDAPLPSTAGALAWASFVNAGQACIAVKRVYVVGDPGPWARALADRAEALRVGDPAGPVDVGPMISVAARDRFHAAIEAAVAAGAEVLAGGRPVEGPGSYYRPTVLKADGPEAEAALAGCFGPVVIVRGVADPEAAVSAANAGPFGLNASVWGRDVRAASALAVRLEAGSVAINEAVTTSAHASAPFGGRKGSGFGRVRGVVGLREMAQPQVIHARNPGGFRPHLFPYSPRMLRIFSAYRRFFHPRG